MASAETGWTTFKATEDLGGKVTVEVYGGVEKERQAFEGMLVMEKKQWERFCTWIDHLKRMQTACPILVVPLKKAKAA